MLTHTSHCGHFPPQSITPPPLLQRCAWPFSGPAFLTILLTQQVFPASTSLFSVLELAQPYVHEVLFSHSSTERKLAGNDLSDKSRGRTREGGKNLQNQDPDVAQALDHLVHQMDVSLASLIAAI